MKIKVKNEKLIHADTDAIIVLTFEKESPSANSSQLIDKQCGGLINKFMASGEYQGKLYQTFLVHTHDKLQAKRIILAGLGKKDELDLDKLRGVFAKAAQYARSLNLASLSVALDENFGEHSLSDVTEAAIEGVHLGLYQFTAFKTIERDEIRSIKEFLLYEVNKGPFEELKRAVKTAEVVCNAVYFARDIVSMPSNKMTPSDLAHEARQIALRHKSLTCKVLSEADMHQLGMNALLGVARGSDEPAQFIILEYRGAKKSTPVIVLVGKGITFDSGGISLKPAEKMDEMKTDMAGAAAVLGAIRAVSDLKLALNVVGLVPATENLPSGKAYKPGDILTSLSGKTIEVLNTDAEGRLILADALAYADRFKPAAILDIATLTGACIIALGEQVIGMLGTDASLKDKVRKSADKTGERVWELPLWEDYHEQIKSDVADFKNTGGRPASTITAAAFLSKFVGNYPWVHLDIAGPAWLTKDRPYMPKGASGIGVRLFTDLLRQWGDKTK